ncbi:hypothetical protein [Streptomyces sp. NPDC002467]|uniref:hypothetical protein n=1 Tax=Streptomyces sp. NPDC002467 TaxID=3364647 RepID=UPI0036BC81C2
MSARDKLFRLAVSQDMVAEEGAAQLLDAYRAEVLAEAIAAANAEYETQDATAARSPYNEGVFDAVSALYRLLNGGAR